MVQQKLLVVDPDLCTGCGICETACSSAHDDKYISPNGRIQRIRIEEVINYAMSCQFCTDPPCVEVCPQKCMERDEKDGYIIVNEDKCDGCSFCIKACPFGAITLHSITQKAIMCDLCLSTEDQEPQCVLFCPKEAISVKTVQGLAQESRKTQVLALLKGLEKEV